MGAAAVAVAAAGLWCLPPVWLPLLPALTSLRILSPLLLLLYPSEPPSSLVFLVL